MNFFDWHDLMRDLNRAAGDRQRHSRFFGHSLNPLQYRLLNMIPNNDFNTINA
jgi:hypothetical protein